MDELPTLEQLEAERKALFSPNQYAISGSFLIYLEGQISIMKKVEPLIEEMKKQSQFNLKTMGETILILGKQNEEMLEMLKEANYYAPKLEEPDFEKRLKELIVKREKGE